MMKKFRFIFFLFCVMGTMEVWSSKYLLISKLNTDLTAGNHLYTDTTPVPKCRQQIQPLQPNQKFKSKKLITGKFPLIAFIENLNLNGCVTHKHNSDLHAFSLRRQQESKALVG